MPETGAKVLASMGRYAAFLKRPIERPASFSDTDPSRARSIIDAAGQTARACLTAEQAWDLLTCYAIPVARYRSAGNVDECLAAADQIGYPIGCG